MRYSFRLAEVVNHVPDPRRRPGTIKAICDYTGLDRHQVAALLKNEVKYVPIDALSKLCGYLIDRGFAKASELPGRLFGVVPEHFWELLARRKRLELCLGVRRGDMENSLDDAWVVASDSVLLGELLNGATTLGVTVAPPGEGSEQALAPAASLPAARPHPEQLHQTLVWSPDQATVEECQRMARAAYNNFCEVAGDKALVCLGSIKSNPVVEMLLASTFGCEPFISQDDLPAGERRSCPIFLRYRDNDPHPLSCCGGQRAGRGQASNKPGIYYELPSGKWDCCPWDADTHDAAFVFYIHRESQGRMEMALGGFSGRATRLLARHLARHGEEFWEPVYEDEGIQIGAFVVKFAITGPAAEDREIIGSDPPAETTVVKLDREVIARRMQQHLAGE
jgi:hypothetical protein